MPADPRANQKARTRAALVDVATRLLREGRQPTVAEVADAALISRATAYRYFPTQEALLVEITDISPAVAPVEARLAELGNVDPVVRLHALLDALNRIMLAEETSMRTSLRIYLDTWLAARSRGDDSPTVREGRRMRWIDDVLAPVRRQLGERGHARVRAALALTLGAEAIVVMRDVCRLRDAEALEVLQWAAAALLKAALDELPAPKPAARARSR